MKRRSYLLTSEMKNFVHRKDQSVLKDALPPKHELVIYIRINKFQKKLYRRFLRAHENLQNEKQKILYFT